MQLALVMTVIGQDRPGLVDSVAGIVADQARIEAPAIAQGDRDFTCALDHVAVGENKTVRRKHKP